MLHPFLQLYLTLQDKEILNLSEVSIFCPFFHFMPSPDALPVAVQPAGEAATAEMVHTDNGAGEEEGDPGHDDVSAEPSTAFLQLPPVERPEDRLQEVATNDMAAFSFVL